MVLAHDDNFPSCFCHMMAISIMVLAHDGKEPTGETPGALLRVYRESLGTLLRAQKTKAGISLFGFGKFPNREAPEQGPTLL